MTIILYMAISVNGYIARPDGNEDFLSPINWRDTVRLSNQYGNVVMGRTTYEENLKWTGENSFRNISGVRKIVVSRQPDLELEPGFELVDSPEAAIKTLDDMPVMVLSGGGSLNTAFAEKGLVDEVIINIEPALIGKGKGIFANGNFDLLLKPISTKIIEDGIIQTHYRVVKESK